MPPKESTKKPPPQIARPPISDSSLYHIPDDALEGFQERLEKGIQWTNIELAAQYHKKLSGAIEIPPLTLSEALKNKIENSIFGSFLNEESKFTLDQLWELLLPITLWDNEVMANEEGKICFRNANNITDDMVKMIKRAVALDDREVLRKEIRAVNVLRVTDSKMTDLDKSLKEFRKLLSLNLCGNFIKDLDAIMVPPCVKSIELQANRIQFVDGFAEHLPNELLYLGLARNLITDDSVDGFLRLPHTLTVLDLSENDICVLEPLLDVLARLPNLTSLMLAGNPCSVCMGYAVNTLMRLPRLKWLDSREVLRTDRPAEPFEPHPDDLRSAYFNFTVFRVMSAAQPPKPEKGAITTFHVEVEIPFLDSVRRQFLMFRRNESLVEMLPPAEDDAWPSKMPSTVMASKTMLAEEASSHESDIYKVLTVKNSREITHFTTFESNRVQWSKVMNFNEPAVRIFCPDLVALRNTFRTVITVRLIYSLTPTAKPGKLEKKNSFASKIPVEQRVVLATVRCALTRPDWSQPSQHFHWDDSLGTSDAIHWGDGDLSVLQYSPNAVKPAKGKPGDAGVDTSRQQPPDNLTCHFGFGIDTLRA